jgi:hypothetical protein
VLAAIQGHAIHIVAGEGIGRLLGVVAIDADFGPGGAQGPIAIEEVAASRGGADLPAIDRNADGIRARRDPGGPGLDRIAKGRLLVGRKLAAVEGLSRPRWMTPPS